MNSIRFFFAVSAIVIWTSQPAYTQVGPVVYFSHTINDDNIAPSQGDNDGRAENCERVELSVTVKNLGTITATGNSGLFGGEITTSDPDVIILDNDNCWPNLPGGATVENACQYAFEISPNLSQDKTVIFTMTLVANNGGPWVSTIPVRIYVQNRVNAPTNLSAQLQSDFSVKLTWQDNDNCESDYRIERRIGSGAAYVDLATVGANTTSYMDNAIPYSGTYYYRLYAINGLYRSDYAADAELQVNLPAFLEAGTSLAAVSNSAVAWADFIANDGKLDFVVVGQENSTQVARVYQNSGDGFADVSTKAALTGIKDGAIAWGDYNNDDGLDLLLTGDATNSAGQARATKLFRYEGSGRFSEVSTALPGTRNGAVAWGDYDNDGDLDVLLTGSPAAGANLAEVYRNTNGSFAAIKAGLPEVGGGSAAAWGDYDNDGDLDIFLAGQDNSLNPIAKVYRNDNGSFIDANAALTGVAACAAAWGDYDNDGDLDILLAGRTGNGNRVTNVHRNNNGIFSNINAGLEGVESGSVAWGDFDNDGDLDILLTGESVSGPIAKVYRNNSPNGGFFDINAPLNGVRFGSAAWGDYDNDSDLDILLSGMASSGNRLAMIYRNTATTANTPPTSPSNLTATAKGSAATFSWTRSTDNAAQNALTYNLRLGTAPGSIDKISPMSSLSDGFRRLPRIGNANHRNSITIKNLPAGTYYWSVQAIDNSFAGSAFANEQSIFVTGNRAPTVANAIASRELAVGGTAFTLNLNAAPAVFNDQDGDILTYTASSSATNIATANVPAGSSVLTVTPVAAGSTVITVTADDGNGATVSTLFTVTMKVNQQPTVANAIPNQNLTVGGAPFTRNLSAVPAVFNDPDGDALSYTASSSLTSIATAGVAGSTLTVSAVSGGSATITISATDGKSPAVSATFTVTVANRPPVVTSQISSQNLTVGGPPFTQNLTAIFSDPDGDALTFTANSSATNIAAANVPAGSGTLTVTAVSGGSATITVSATDGKSPAVSTTFTAIVANRPPVVANTISNQSLTIGGAPFTQDLTVIFSDPDGDPLTFNASSSAVSIATVTVAGSTLTVSAMSGGSATITVLAMDGKNPAVATTFMVNVGNRPPIPLNLIPSQSLAVGGPPFSQNLNLLFSDPDGDALTFTASSSATNIATANVPAGSSTLTVTAVAGGNATITVTATDGKSPAIAATFSVTVANRSPLVTSTVSTQSLSVGGAPFTQNLTANFSDPDGDPLTFTASASAPNIATAAVPAGSSILTVTAVSGGAAVITVTASDGKLTVSTSFNVTVANRPPTVSNAISNRSLAVGGAPFTQNLTAVFSDPDGDALTFSANSSATNVVTASVTSATLTAAAVATGSATITVTANDGKGGATSTSFEITVSTNSPANIVHSATSSAPSGQNILIAASVTDDRGVSRVDLNYREGGSMSFTSTQMTLTTGSDYQATIPASAVTSRGVEYFISATDVDNAPARNPGKPNDIYAIQIQVTSASKPGAQSNGSAQTAYRLVSVPLQLENPSVAAVLEDDLGPYDNTKWRLFGLAAGQSQNLTSKEPYVEFPNAGANAFMPGASLFLIVKDPGKIITSGAARSMRTDQSFKIALQPGHNLIATPFNFPIPVGKLTLKSGGNLNALKTYGSAGPVPETIALQPWEGYYFPNVNQQTDTLLVNPSLAASVATKTSALSGWRLRILAGCAEARDEHNFAGVSPESHDGYDDNDLAEPPPIGEYVSLYFPHPEWRKALSRFSDDMRSASSPNQKWRFVVESNVPDAIVTLRFNGLQDLPANLDIVLIDEALSFKQNLREQATYQYQPRHGSQPQEFTLIVGQAEFVAGHTTNTQGVPENFFLEQNFPNPFGSAERSRSPETAIRFGLPQPGAVSIKIFDLAGHEIVTLLDRAELPPGRHQRVWNGRDAQGRMVTGGIYFCQLTAGNVARTMKLMLLR